MWSTLRHAVLLLAAASAACPEPMQTPTDQGANGKDMSVTGPADLSAANLAPPPDLYLPDLAPATIDPKPACEEAAVTAEMIYPIVQMRCADELGYCHFPPGMAGRLVMGMNAAEMRTALLMDARSAALKRVEPGDVDKSMLIYLLTRQQAKVARRATSIPMPPAAPLPDDELCLFYNWVRSGAL